MSTDDHIFTFACSGVGECVCVHPKMIWDSPVTI